VLETACFLYATMDICQYGVKSVRRSLIVG